MMSQRALEFIETWVSENIHPEAYEPEGDGSRAESMAAICRAEANAAGISDSEIAEQVDSLTDFIAGQIQETTDREVDRIIARDKS